MARHAMAVYGCMYAYSGDDTHLEKAAGEEQPREARPPPHQRGVWWARLSGPASVGCRGPSFGARAAGGVRCAGPCAPPVSCGSGQMGGRAACDADRAAVCSWPRPGGVANHKRLRARTRQSPPRRF